jgi:hypothetical protein
MTTKQTYESFIIKINENATTDNISCDKGRFVIMFNNNQNRQVEHYIERKFEDDIRYIQKLLVDDLKISTSSKHLDHQDFELPKDFFDNSNLYCLASNGKCQKQKIDCFEIKDDDRNNILSDTNNNPSFKYREAPYHISSDKIKIYTADEFTIDTAILSYYRYPQQIGLINPENPESDFNLDNPEFDDKFVNRVIDLCVADFQLNSDDQKFQMNRMNATNKN